MERLRFRPGGQRKRETAVDERMRRVQLTLSAGFAHSACPPSCPDGLFDKNPQFVVLGGTLTGRDSSLASPQFGSKTERR